MKLSALSRSWRPFLSPHTLQTQRNVYAKDCRTRFVV